MQTLSSDDPIEISENERTITLFGESQDQIHLRTDRMFAWLMLFQWVGGIAAALWISPRTWIGATSQTHVHVWAAIFLGGAISGFPIFLAFKRPGQAFTRHTIAVAQMLTSALLIHLTGGRIETHFHVFGSLAFLAFYRDWRVLVSATVVVALDHLLRGIFLPQSVFGVLTPSSWRWLEHAGWVIFEDVFLVVSIQQSRRDMRQVAERQARLEAMNESIEQRVRERTHDLEREIHERIETQTKLEETHNQLLQVSRQAGMAEVATGVLHNVGNVLNSVSVSATVVCDRLRQSEVDDIQSAAAMLEGKNGQLGQFLTNDPKGKLLPEYLAKASKLLVAERDDLVSEMAAMVQHIEHIKEIVAMQQTYAKVFGVLEPVPPTALVQDALRMNAAAFERHGIRVIQQFDEDVPPAFVDRHKVLQILVNLLRNAKYAMEEQAPAEKRLEIHVGRVEGGNVVITVRDNGVGIASENLTRIFGHGFTTKKDGHGFGLHSGALAARQMNGSLSVHSEGPGQGATFTLELPVAPTADIQPCADSKPMATVPN
ncbi:MAG TPA: ATP-binding protein [Candidatus Binatia bacterium]|jgi:signal transduction histidine kinase|nr:ATP-binding protein [Candidatus Binatia bacterium]